MLAVSQLSRSYGDFLAVDQVSFSIDKGEIVGLLGHNGAGKTTIMKMLGGYLEPDQGQVTIAGLDLATHTKQAQRQLGYLPENLPVYPDMVVADYLEFAAQLKGLQGDAQRSEIRRVVQATDIGAKLLSPIATLSRGLKQRVGVAQAILGSPKLLILDEPTNGLDPTQTEHMRQLIRELARDATVILSTHIMQEVDALCSRVLILRAGQVSVDASLEDLRFSNHALLVTSLAPEDALARLETLEGITGAALQFADREGQPFEYRLALEPTGQHQAICARVAAAVAEARAELYSLQMEHRDLETLFREVSQAPLSNLADSNLSDGGSRDAA
jgi:ABC-2 type transport system ATP-binding protein